jgi:hypothetical protein
MKRTLLKGFTALIIAFLPFAKVNAQAFSESFNDITLLAGNGWVMTNASSPVGSINWFQGNPVGAGGPFDAFNGATNAYIGANFNSTGSTGTISNWLMTPNRTFRNGDVLTFYTRKPTPNPTDYPDRLEVRLSSNGASTNVGSGAAVGDFTSLLLSINPSLVVGGYPTTWTQYTITISGLSAPTSGRIAFRYFVTSAGSLGTNSDYIGIDQVDYTPYVCPSFTMTAGGALTGATAGSAYSNTLTQTGALGAPNFAITAGALPPGLSISSAGTISGTPTATGTFNFTATVSDASGCSGSQSYSITVVCPSNPITFTAAPSLCNNDGAYTLVEGSPAGGSYSGVGVTGGDFDPINGTQSITYDYTDTYGCNHTSNYSITVNTAPVVTLDPFAAICDNEGILALTGESPVGGSFSGTGVTGTDFDPSAGTQTVTYSYTDGNGCSNNAAQTITVNVAPVVSHDPISAICENAGVTAISGGLPIGGTYSGTGMTGSDFDPTLGDQTITYTYVDANGCSESTTATITVIPSETATLSAIPATCDNTGDITLTQGLPVGGVYSGTGVTGDQFDPTVGSQTITYTIGGGTACESSATTLISVNAAPTVTFTSSITDLCVYDSDLTLSGGLPSGGTYTGTATTGGVFSPATAGLGITTITYTYVDGNGCSNVATDDITVDACAGIIEGTSAAIEVAPNPSNGMFVLSGVDVNAMTQISIVDLNGKQVASSIQYLNENAVSISIVDAVNGIYVLKGNYKDQIVQLRLMKQ